MKTVNVHQAKTHLSRLLNEVEHGESVVLARSGHPVARLTAVEVHPVAKRQLGCLRGTGQIPDDPTWGDSAVAAMFANLP